MSVTAALFANGEDGFLYGNWAELDELFPNSTGPTNVVADSDPVGLALDDHSWGSSSLALMLAAATQLLTNPGPAFTATTGWTAAGNAALSVVAEKLRITNVGTNFGYCYQSFATVIGATYAVSVLGVADDASTNNAFHIGNSAGGADVVANQPCTGVLRYVVALATTTYLSLNSRSNVDTGYRDITSVSFKRVPGNHSLTATAGQRPLWRANSGKPYLQCDGSDDRLVSPIVPTANFTLAVAFNATAVSDVAIGGGASTGGKRAFIGTDAGGGIGYGWGDVNTLTNSTTSILSANHVAILSGQGTTRVRLWLDGALVFDNSTISTAPDGTGGGVALAGYNNNGTPASFMAGSLFAAIALNRVVTEAEVADITRQFQRTYL